MFKPNLETILNGFNTTITKLEELDQRNAVAVADNEAYMAHLRNETGALIDESNRAKIIAERLRNLLTA